MFSIYPPFKGKPYQFVARIARICYRSEPQSSPDSDRRLVEKLAKRDHWPMFEHLWLEVGNVPGKVVEHIYDLHDPTQPVYPPPYLWAKDGKIYGNVTAFQNHGLGHYPARLLNLPIPGPDELNGVRLSGELEWDNTHVPDTWKDWHPITIIFHKRFERGQTHEQVRHRYLTSFAQESTRWCNYGSKRRLRLVEPWGLKWWEKLLWSFSTGVSGLCYNLMTSAPQWKRSVLPISVRAPIAVTMPLMMWRHVSENRIMNSYAHPQLRVSLARALGEAADRFWLQERLLKDKWFEHSNILELLKEYHVRKRC